MARANYTAVLKTYRRRNVLEIVDLNLGGVSVTNDIEAVVKQCFKDSPLKPEQCYIVYQDSEGNWDGWDHATQNFVSLNGSSAEDALDKYLTKYERLT